MKKSSARVISFAIITIVLLLSLVLVSAQGEIIKKTFSEGFTKWLKGEGLGDTFNKVLIFAIILIVLIAISDVIPGLGGIHISIRVILSIAVAILGTSYIIPDVIYTMIQGYSALAFAIGVGVPFLIMLGFSIKIGLDNDSNSTDKAVKKLMAWMMWVFFIAYLIWRYIALIFEVNEVEPIASSYKWGLIVLIAISIIILIGLGRIWSKLSKVALSSDIQTAKHKYKLAIENIKANANAAKDLANSGNKD